VKQKPIRRSRIYGYAFSAAAVAAAVSLTLLVRLLFPLNPTPLVIAAVVVAAWSGGKYPGLFACLLADLAIDYFFETPPYQFDLAMVHIIRVGILAVIALLTSARRKAEDKLKMREKQQAVIAELGQQALSRIPLARLFDETAETVRRTLDVDYSAILKMVSDGRKMRFVAGSGWRETVVGNEFDYDAENSLAGHVVSIGKPVIFENLNAEKRFAPSKIVKEHQVHSGMGVIIPLQNRPFGVLGAFDRRSRSFSTDDINFLQAVSNVLAEAVERMRAEDVLREQREWLRITLSSIGDAVIATDREGRITFMNPVAEKATGWNEKEAAGKHLEEVFKVINEESRRKVETPVEKVIREGIIVGLANHTVLISKDGTEIPIDDSAAPIRDKTGGISGIVLVFHDITERKRAETAREFLSNASAVLSSSLDLETTLNSLADLIVPAFADMCVIDLVRAKNEIERLAVTVSDPSKQELAETIKQCSNFDPAAGTGIPKVLRTGRSELYKTVETAPLSAELVCGSTEIGDILRLQPASVMIVPLIAHGQTVGVISLLTENGRSLDENDLRLIEDFAHRAALAVDNANLYKTLQEANRIKDEFLATLSHELRTPLSSILGWAMLLRSNNYPPEQIEKAVETIERNARSQKQIVEDVLDVSRIITGKLRMKVGAVNLKTIVEAAIETIRPSADAKNISINLTEVSVVPDISGDVNRLQQVMWNLLSNAVKFTPKGGRVEISLDSGRSNVEITVSDTGKGISRDFLPFVFDRFRQADGSRTRTAGGLGLGLAIVQYIVELHGGEVKAESAGEGAGAVFTLSLPVLPLVGGGSRISPDGRKASTEPVQAAEENHLDDLNILVVEDDADSRTMIVVLLEQSGAIVTAVASAREGLEVLETEKPDIIISDIGLPEEDGYEFMRKYRTLAPPDENFVPAIAFTAYAAKEDRRESLEAGYQMHLAKPIEPDELIRAIRNLVSSN
jgi:PAS domain S-box-containing protein